MLLVLFTHYGYYGHPSPEWAFYIARGVEGAILFLLLARYVSGTLAVVACLWGALEEAQVSLCGMASMGETTNGDLCMDLFGPLPYAVLASGLLIFLWGRRRDRKN